MTTDLATISTQMAAPLQNEGRLELALGFEQVAAAIGNAFPGELGPDERRRKTGQLIQQAIIHIGQSEAREYLLRCTTVSVTDSLVACASLGLSLTKAEQLAYLVPFKTACTLMVGYRGFIKLICNTGRIASIESNLVYEGDEFKVWRDEQGPHWIHEENLTHKGDAKKVIGCYAVAHAVQGPPLLETMNLAQLQQVEKFSRMAGKGAYSAWRTEMWRKAPIRRLEKYIPKSADDLATQLLARAIELDNAMYDPARVQQYEAIANEQSAGRKARAEARLAKKAVKVTCVSAVPAEAAPAEAQPSGNPGELPPALATRAMKQQLIDDTQMLITDAGGAIDARALIQDAAQAVLGKRQIDTADELQKVKDELANWDKVEGVRIPANIGQEVGNGN